MVRACRIGTTRKPLVLWHFRTVAIKKPYISAAKRTVAFCYTHLGGVGGRRYYRPFGRGAGPREPTQKQKNFVCQPALRKPQPLRRPRFANCERAPLDARPAPGRLTKRTRAALPAD